MKYHLYELIIIKDPKLEKRLIDIDYNEISVIVKIYLCPFEYPNCLCSRIYLYKKKRYRILYSKTSIEIYD